MLEEELCSVDNDGLVVAFVPGLRPDRFVPLSTDKEARHRLRTSDAHPADGVCTFELLRFRAEAYGLRLAGVERVDQGPFLAGEGAQHPTESLDALPGTGGRRRDDCDAGIGDVDA